MPMKAARLGPRPVFRLPQMPVAARASRLSCEKPGKNGNIHASFRVIRGIPVAYIPVAPWAGEVLGTAHDDW